METIHGRFQPFPEIGTGSPEGGSRNEQRLVGKKSFEYDTHVLRRIRVTIPK